MVFFERVNGITRLHILIEVIPGHIIKYIRPSTPLIEFFFFHNKMKFSGEFTPISPGSKNSMNQLGLIYHQSPKL